MGLLSLVTFLPLLGALFLAFIPEGQARVVKMFAGLVAIATFGFSMVLLVKFHSNDFHFQLLESADWIPSLGVKYLMGVDGISLWMVLLTTFLGVVASLLSTYESKRLKSFLILILLLETSLIGTFLALDMILFYTFFELSLFPMAFLIWIWGDENRKKAAMRYFIYLFGGSILMLVGIVVLAHQNQVATGKLSFSIIDLQATVASGKMWAGSFKLEQFVFWAFAIAFLIKSPSFPFHTWLVDSYTQAPVGAVLLGALVKTGIYGLVRFCLPLFPDVIPSAAPIILALAVIGIIYGAALAAVQRDMKRVIAYSSVSHVGFILLGVFGQTHTSLMGGVLGGFYHGIASGLLIVLVSIICLRRGSRDVSDFGGLKAQMPTFSALFLIATLAAVGLPGTNGFVSEFLSLMGTFESGFVHLAGLNILYAVFATAGVIFAAVYMLLLFQKVFYGPNNRPEILRLKDIHDWELVVAGAFAVLIIVGGLAPTLFTKDIESSVQVTRLMSQNQVGSVPVWADPNQSLNEFGQLQVNQANPTMPANYHVISDSNFHFPEQNLSTGVNEGGN